MNSIISYLQRPQVHAALTVLSYLAGVFYPAYKPIFDQLMAIGGYGAMVTGLHLVDPNAPEGK